LAGLEVSGDLRNQAAPERVHLLCSSLLDVIEFGGLVLLMEE